MQIEHFLKLRTKFIRYFYENAARPFIEIKTAIEAEKEPFVPPYSESGEPPFLEEWMEADTGLETVGHTCISMLSSSLQLFLMAWVGRWESERRVNFNVNFKKKGWFNGYKEIFENIGLPISNCGADLDVVEQTTLARNRGQHPEEITRIDVTHSQKDLKRFPNPFFAEEIDLKIANILSNEGSIRRWLKPPVKPTKEKVFEATKQVEILCAWLEEEYRKARDL